MGEADSVTVDAHKGLFLPYGIGALLVRDRASLTAANVEHGAYMRALPSVAGLPHYFELGPELTRPFRGLIAWLPLHLHGVAAFRDTLDRMLDLAERAAHALGRTPGVRVFSRPQLSIVTVGATAGDDATRRLLDAVNDSGRFQVSSTTIDGRLAVRLAFLSQRTTEREVDEVVALIARTTAR
jgi:aromatic-L-amino-acid decarboxylase